MDESVDLIVIGAGSGGVAAARRSAAHGAKVMLIEQARVGGTCVLRGCVPKKLLMYAGQHGQALAEAGDFGWQLPAPARFEMATWARAKAAETARLEQVYRQGLTTSGVSLIQGRGRLAGAGRVAVDGRLLQAPKILLATGASTRRGVIPGDHDLPGSDEILDLQTLPACIDILGGGYIGVEFASILAALGCKVRLRYRDTLPLRGFDLGLRQAIDRGLRAQGIELLAGQMPDQVQRSRDGWQLQVGGESVPAAYVMTALGRSPQTEDLGLQHVGLNPAAGAGLTVDEELQTVVPGLYALGDITHRLDLTPVAIAQGRWLADRLFGASQSPPPSLQNVPTAVFSLPPAATVGLIEADCPPGTAVYERQFKPMRLAFSQRPERVWLKVLLDPVHDRLLGIHMHGMDAPEIIQSLTVAVKAGLGKQALDQTMALHPSSAEEFMLLGQPSRHLGG